MILEKFLRDRSVAKERPLAAHIHAFYAASANELTSLFTATYIEQI